MAGNDPIFVVMDSAYSRRHAMSLSWMVLTLNFQCGWLGQRECRIACGHSAVQLFTDVVQCQRVVNSLQRTHQTSLSMLQKFTTKYGGAAYSLHGVASEWQQKSAYWGSFRLVTAQNIMHGRFRNFYSCRHIPFCARQDNAIYRHFIANAYTGLFRWICMKYGSVYPSATEASTSRTYVTTYLSHIDTNWLWVTLMRLFNAIDD